MENKVPKISVFSTVKNGERYLKESLDSIFNQTFQDFEIVLVDGVSTDDTLKILNGYKTEPRLRWISEPDNDANEGFYKALTMARGEYVMLCPISDGYLSRNWFARCADILDNNKNISLVYGMTLELFEDGSFGSVREDDWFDTPPPDEMEYLPYWLATFRFISEKTYCVRAHIYKSTFPDLSSVEWDYYNPPDPMTDEYFTTHACFLKQRYNFITHGYLTKFLPIVASYARVHTDSRNYAFEKFIRLSQQKYVSYIIHYRNDVLSGKKKHIFRDGFSNEIKDISHNDLSLMKRKIINYRMNSKIDFEYRDNLNISNINNTNSIRIPCAIFNIYRRLIYAIYKKWMEDKF